MSNITVLLYCKSALKNRNIDKNIWCMYSIAVFRTLRFQRSFQLSVHVFDLRREIRPDLWTFHFERGRQQSVLYGKRVRMQVDVFHLRNKKQKTSRPHLLGFRDISVSHWTRFQIKTTRKIVKTVSGDRFVQNFALKTIIKIVIAIRSTFIFFVFK